MSYCDLKWQRMTSRTVQLGKVYFSRRQTNKRRCFCTSRIALLCRSTVLAGFSRKFWRPLCSSRVISSSQDLGYALFWDVTKRRVVNSLPTLRDSLSVPSSRVERSKIWIISQKSAEGRWMNICFENIRKLCVVMIVITQLYCQYTWSDINPYPANVENRVSS